MANKRRKHAANCEPDHQGEVPWWTPTPEEQERTEAARNYLLDVIEGRIKPERLTRAQRIIGLHMQA